MYGITENVLLDEKTLILFNEQQDIGYEIKMSSLDLLFIEKEITENINLRKKIYLYHQLAEGVSEFFGFLKEADLAFFKLLLTVNGVGPKTALNMISKNSTEYIISLIKYKNLSLLSKLPGISNNAAKKLISELEGKLSNFGDEDLQENNETSSLLNDVFESLSFLQKRNSIPDEEIIKIVSENTKSTLEEIIAIVLSKA